ncbi:hypothetical protein OMAG_002196 [Candidatus Omnitrophus magneticus]|uniref:Uncharacterized protein n=1 Tax=Candidatus Omnitrophus magneticus TaxID=1609969 RepID=A0A0F0CPH1_9BACT|nr:hypothetical protein OMAG_002196 [Candidatus Omnitrophus magneticus]
MYAVIFIETLRHMVRNRHFSKSIYYIANRPVCLREMFFEMLTHKAVEWDKHLCYATANAAHWLIGDGTQVLVPVV